MPTNSDLVTDLPADFEVFGQAVDTSLMDLKGGTSGQILSKASNTDMDFSWIASPGSNTENWSVLNGSTGTALTGATTITVSGISGKKQLLILVKQASSASASSYISVRLNTDSATNYLGTGSQILANANPSNIEDYQSIQTATTGTTQIYIGQMGNTVGARVSGSVKITGGTNTTSPKTYTAMGSGDNVATAIGFHHQGFYLGTSAISSVSIISSVGNFDSGTVWIFGSDY